MSSIIKGSLTAITKDKNIGLAEAFLNADTVILVDTSGSMADRDYVDGDTSTRYERACRELTKLQNNLEGRIAVISFSTTAMFCPDGKPYNLCAGTNLAEALRFVCVADGVVDRFIVISDGYPDDGQSALAEARKFTTAIDTIYIGEPGSSGEDFLKRLAQAHRGQSSTLQGGINIAKNVERLMLAA